MKVPRVLLADDHSVVLAGIRSAVGSFCELLGEVTDGRSLVTEALRIRPDLIILDVSMPTLNGIDAARQIKKAWPEAKLLFLSMHKSPIYLRAALAAGGSGYVLKSSAAEELPIAVQTVLRGKTYIAPEFGRDYLQNLATASGRHVSTGRLTDRQREVLQLIAEGRSNKEVAGILRVSVKTVEFHRARIMEKAGVHTTAELARFAAREGLVSE